MCLIELRCTLLGAGVGCSARVAGHVERDRGGAGAPRERARQKHAGCRHHAVQRLCASFHNLCIHSAGEYPSLDNPVREMAPGCYRSYERLWDVLRCMRSGTLLASSLGGAPRPSWVICWACKLAVGGWTDGRTECLRCKGNGWARWSIDARGHGGLARARRWRRRGAAPLPAMRALTEWAATTTTVVVVVVVVAVGSAARAGEGGHARTRRGRRKWWGSSAAQPAGAARRARHW